MKLYIFYWMWVDPLTFEGLLACLYGVLKEVNFFRPCFTHAVLLPVNFETFRNQTTCVFCLYIFCIKLSYCLGVSVLYQKNKLLFKREDACQNACITNHISNIIWPQRTVKQKRGFFNCLWCLSKNWTWILSLMK